jgi:hypothetical protein
MKLFLNWGLRMSEKQIMTFLDLFSQGDIEQNGAVLGMAALLHHQIKTKDPQFETLVNSKKGENQGPISVYIFQLNRLVNEFHKSGRYDEAAAMKLWNVTFRCMSHESLHHYGVEIWKIAAQSFPVAKQWLKEKLKQAERAGNKQDAASLKEALKLYNYVPPQFRAS